MYKTLFDTHNQKSGGGRACPAPNQNAFVLIF